MSASQFDTAVQSFFSYYSSSEVPTQKWSDLLDPCVNLHQLQARGSSILSNGDLVAAT